MPSDLIAEKIRVVTGSMAYTVSAVDIVDPNGIVTEPSGSLIRSQDGRLWTNTDGASSWVLAGPNRIGLLVSGSITGTLDFTAERAGTFGGSLRVDGGYLQVRSTGSATITLAADTENTVGQEQNNAKLLLKQDGELSKAVFMMTGDNTNDLLIGVSCDSLTTDPSLHFAVRLDGNEPTTSDAKLTIEHTGRATFSGAAIFGGDVTIARTGTAILHVSADTDNVTETDVARIQLSQDGVVSTGLVALDESNHLIIGANSTTSPNIVFATNNVGTSYVTAAQAKMTIANNGNVTMINDLTVQGSLTGSGDAVFGRNVYAGSNGGFWLNPTRTAGINPGATDELWIRSGNADGRIKVMSTGRVAVSQDLLVSGSITGSGRLTMPGSADNIHFIRGETQFQGPDHATHINYVGTANRNTYIRAGYTPGTIFIGDINSGDVRLGATANRSVAMGDLRAIGSLTGSGNGTFTGKLGIGTSAPSSKVEIAGGGSDTTVGSHSTEAFLRIRNSNGTVNNFQGIVFGGTARAALEVRNINPTSNYADMYLTSRGTDGWNTRMFISASSDVGINTTAPASRFHVVRTTSGITPPAGTVATIEGGSGDVNVSILGTSNKGIHFANTASNVDGGIIYDNPNAVRGLQFRTGGNTTRVTIDAAGDTLVHNDLRVSGTLDVQEQINAYSNLLVNGGTTLQSDLSVAGNATFGNQTTDSHTVHGLLNLSTPNSTIPSVRHGRQGGSYTWGHGHDYQTQGYAYYWYNGSGWSQKFLIDQTGSFRAEADGRVIGSFTGSGDANFGRAIGVGLAADTNVGIKVAKPTGATYGLYVSSGVGYFADNVHAGQDLRVDGSITGNLDLKVNRNVIIEGDDQSTFGTKTSLNILAGFAAPSSSSPVNGASITVGGTYDTQQVIAAFARGVQATVAGSRSLGDNPVYRIAFDGDVSGSEPNAVNLAVNAVARGTGTNAGVYANAYGGEISYAVYADATKYGSHIPSKPSWAIWASGSVNIVGDLYVTGTIFGGGVTGGGSMDGSGTTRRVPRFSAATTLTDSNINDPGNNSIEITGSITGTLDLRVRDANITRALSVGSTFTQGNYSIGGGFFNNLSTPIRMQSGVSHGVEIGSPAASNVPLRVFGPVGTNASLQLSGSLTGSGQGKIIQAGAGRTAPSTNGPTFYVTQTGSYDTTAEGGIAVALQGNSVAGRTAGSNVLINVGVEGQASNASNLNIGVRGTATGSASTNYGGYFSANGATTNYAIFTDGGDVYLSEASLKVEGNVTASSYAVGDTATPARLYLGRQVFTSNGTYTPTDGTKSILIKMVGGGGGGGSYYILNFTTLGGGGAGGMYVEKYISAMSSATGSIVIGAAGAGGNNSVGGTGGDTVFFFNNTNIAAKGGLGGARQTWSAGWADGGGTQSVSQTVDLQFQEPGQEGYGFQSLASNTFFFRGGQGGSSPFGVGGRATFTNSSVRVTGNAGTGRGAGGGGHIDSLATGGVVVQGGAGTAGLVIIDEYG